MAKILLFISLIFVFSRCNSDSTEDSSTKKGASIQPANTIELIAGTWKIIKGGDEDLREHPEYNSIRHVFVADSTWVLSQALMQEDSLVTAVSGGYWYYDAESQQLVTIGLPDSTEVRSTVVSISDTHMEMMSASKRKYIWERVK